MTSPAERLRQKLLDLAIRGKLVPQDAHDEPAAELLKRIQAEKKKLVAVQKIRKEKPLPPIADDEKPFDLPAGWAWCRLGEIASKIGAGSTPTGGKKVYVEAGIKFIREQNVYCDGLHEEGMSFIDEATNQRMAGTIVRPGDMLMNITGGSIGRTALVPDDFDIGNVNQHVLIVRATEQETRQYLHLVLCSQQTIRLMFARQVGDKPGLSAEKVKMFPIPLPPLAEQKRIVAALDAMLKEVDAVASGMAKLAELKDKARAKILDLAIRGKLVRQDAHDEPAAELLKRIQAEKKKLIAAKKIRKEKPLSPIEDDEKPFDLPNGWAWSRLADITHSGCLNDGDWILSDDMVEDGPIKLLQLGSVGDGVYVKKGFKHLTTERCAQLGCTDIHPGYLLVNRMIGDKLLACILPEIQGRVITAVDVCWIAPSEFYQIKYLLCVVLSHYFQFIAKSKGAGDGRVRISKGNLIKIPIPLPPLAEQKRIVEKVEKMLAACEALAGGGDGA